MNVVGRHGVAFQVIAGDEGDADSQGNQAGEEPGTEMKGNGGEHRRQKIANGIEANGQGQPNHGDDEARTQYPTAATLALKTGRMHAGANHRHVLAMLQVTYEHNKREEDSQCYQPTGQNYQYIFRHLTPLHAFIRIYGMIYLASNKFHRQKNETFLLCDRSNRKYE